MTLNYKKKIENYVIKNVFISYTNVIKYILSEKIKNSLQKSYFKLINKFRKLFEHN